MLRTLHIGLGTIGRAVVKATVKSGKGHPVAGVDPVFAGQRLSELPDVPAVDSDVFADLSQALSLRPDVAVISTFSKVEAIADDLRRLISAGINVVSTCETCAIPGSRRRNWPRNSMPRPEMPEYRSSARV